MNPTNKKLNSQRLNGLTQKTPYLVIDLSNIENKYKLLSDALPNFTIFYAVKCNPEQKILETLAKKGSSFEIASKGELERLEKIGVNPKDVIFSNPVKPIDHIETVYKQGLTRFAFDSPEELTKIAKYAPGSSVYLRLSVSNHGSLINLSNKFGANKSHAVQLLSLAEDLGLEPYGISFHVGSQAENEELWSRAFEDVFKAMNDLDTKGIRIKSLNIGGGFPVKYTEPATSIEKIGKQVAASLRNLPYDIDLFCEPGRYLVGEAGVIAGTIIGKTTRHNTPWLYVDVGRFQAFIEMFESSSLEYPIFTSIDGTDKANHKETYTITGPSCDSYDTISRDVRLPKHLDVGDVLYFATAGAYTHVYGAAFNDFPVPKVIYL
jgi:ornithine decarboxylase